MIHFRKASIVLSKYKYLLIYIFYLCLFMDGQGYVWYVHLWRFTNHVICLHAKLESCGSKQNDECVK